MIDISESDETTQKAIQKADEVFNKESKNQELLTGLSRAKALYKSKMSGNLDQEIAHNIKVINLLLDFFEQNHEFQDRQIALAERLINDVNKKDKI